ncbi:MAG: HRDC domain-containing protein [Elusimicrobia bacterium]|nr:HRDC domain-containing protein [Elusimicrobiota bacterium]
MSVEIVATESALEGAVARAQDFPAVSLDTESDSFYRYPERLCLAQLAAGDRVWLIDTLSIRRLDSLQRLLENPHVGKIFHAAEYDVAVLRRRCPSLTKVANLFDTMAAARILGWNDLGLSAILETRFSVRLDKDMQRSNWGLRPLTKAQIHYAAEDVRYLAALSELQARELKERERWEHAREAFEALAYSEIAITEFNPEGFRSLKGAADLDGSGLARLRALYLLREQEARARHLPPFKVLTNALMVDLAGAAPSTRSQLKTIRGVSPYIFGNYGVKILKALERARAGPAVGPGPFSRRELSRDQVRLYGKLKDWRKAVAQTQGVAPDVIVSNDALKKIAKAGPGSVDALAALEVIGPWKLKEYGESLVAAVRCELP